MKNPLCSSRRYWAAHSGLRPGSTLEMVVYSLSPFHITQNQSFPLQFWEISICSQRNYRQASAVRSPREKATLCVTVRPTHWSALPAGRHFGPAMVGATGEPALRAGSYQGSGRALAGAGREPTGPAHHVPTSSGIRREQRADDMRAYGRAGMSGPGAG